ncbi:S-adenosylmethionine synthetase [Bacilli bacterium PM5-3]|nr:S-adenosylmethionine synthetase [Bacilli bacterium PM5-3]MDH6603770.1 S-adenosylmethionine synthetase [Bacilli bacterium PM5-9]
MEELRLFTSESVSEGHPDKVCDQISDAILDAVLKQDPNSRVACECFATTQQIVVGGEIRTNAQVDYEQIVRNKLREIGYVHEDLGINCDTCKVDILLHKQSQDIALGVDDTTNEEKQIGAGDQGIMFGFACNETKGYMPYAIVIAHNLVREASKQRKSGEFKWARPDMKSQVTIDYTDEENPKIHTVLMSIQHDPDYNHEEFVEYIKEHIIKKVLSSYDMANDDYKVLINPTGRFVIGGPHGDSGLTGRKIIVDTYGGYSRHGGGAFSGKDATKVDRSAAYAARWVAKNIVAAGLCDKCEIQLSYAIGKANPISILIETFNTNHIAEEKINEAVRDNFYLTPSGIIKALELSKPIYSQVAAYGHMGRNDIELPWEKLDKVDVLKKYLD